VAKRYGGTWQEDILVSTNTGVPPVCILMYEF
jgi:hypothetical protein